MSKRDYYEVLGVATNGDRRRAEERVPQAGDEVPPGSQSGRQGRRGTDSRKRPRRTPCSPTPRSAASTTASATPASARRPARAGGFDPSVFSEFGDFADILGNMFGFGDLFGGGRRRGGPQRGADLRYDLEITFEESARGTETTIQIPRQEACETCNGTGAAPGSTPTHLPAVPRPGPGPLPAGLLHRRPHVPAVPRHGQDHHQAVRDLPRRRARDARAQDHGQDSRRHRHGPAAAAARRRRSRQRRRTRRAICTSSSTCRSTSSSGATASTCSARSR